MTLAVGRGSEVIWIQLLPPDGVRVGMVGRWRKGTSRPYLHMTDEVLAAHMTGDVHIGLYPLPEDDVCHWLAADFDGGSAMLDARCRTCKRHELGERNRCVPTTRFTDHTSLPQLVDHFQTLTRTIRVRVDAPDSSCTLTRN